MFDAGLSLRDLLGDTTHKRVKDDYRFIKPFKEDIVLQFFREISNVQQKKNLDLKTQSTYYLSEKNLRGYLC